MALSNTAFDGKLSLTISAWLSSNLEDVLLGNNAFFTKLRQMGKVKTGGFGIQMVEPLMFPDASGGGPQVNGVTDPYALLTQTAMTGVTSASYTAAEYVIPVSVAQYDMDQQGSDTQKVDLVQSTMENALARFTSKLNADVWAPEENVGSAGTRSQMASIRTFFNAGKGATTGGGTPQALPGQVGNQAVASVANVNPVTVVGGIERNATGAAYFCTPLITAADTLTMQVLSKIYSLTVRNSDHADLIIVHRDSMDKIQSLLTVGGGNGGQMFTNSKLADAGFEAVRYRGADIIASDEVPTSCFLNNSATAYGYNIFAINSNYLKLRAKSLKPEMLPHDDQRPIKVWTGRFVGQLTSSHLGRVHARHVNVTN